MLSATIYSPCVPSKIIQKKPKMELECPFVSPVPFNTLYNPVSEVYGEAGRFSLTFRASATTQRRARLTVQRRESRGIVELDRPISEYMSLPASQYSVLDAQRIERIDESTFKCYAHKVQFFSFEVCPVLTVRVDQRPNGCCISMLSCSLEGSPIVKTQNDNFAAFMENNVSWQTSEESTSSKIIVSETRMEVDLVIPPAFSFLSIDIIETTGNQVLSQLLRIVLPRFLEQLAKDYKAWASGDESRKPLGTGEL